MSRRVVVRVPGVIELFGREGVAIAVEPLVTASFTLDGGAGGPRVERVGAAAAATPAPGASALLAGARAACHRARQDVPARLHARVALATQGGLGAATAETVAGAAGANALLALCLRDEDVLLACIDAGAPPDGAAAALLGGVVAGRRPEDGVAMHAGVAVHESLAVITSSAISGGPRPGFLQFGSGEPVAEEQRWALVHGLATGDDDLVARTVREIADDVWPEALAVVRTTARGAGALGVFGAPRSGTVVLVAPRAVAPRVADAVHEAWHAVGMAVATEIRSPSVDGHRVVVQQLCDDSIPVPGAAAHAG